MSFRDLIDPWLQDVPPAKLPPGQPPPAPPRSLGGVAASTPDISRAVAAQVSRQVDRRLRSAAEEREALAQAMQRVQAAESAAGSALRAVEAAEVPAKAAQAATATAAAELAKYERQRAVAAEYERAAILADPSTLLPPDDERSPRYFEPWIEAAHRRVDVLKSAEAQHRAPLDTAKERLDKATSNLAAANHDFAVAAVRATAAPLCEQLVQQVRPLLGAVNNVEAKGKLQEAIMLALEALLPKAAIDAGR